MFTIMKKVIKGRKKVHRRGHYLGGKKMGRIVHFEIHVNDMERAKRFYGDVFGWKFEDYSEYAEMPYFGAVTGDDGELGINGALMQRQGPPPEPNQALNGYVCTMQVDDYD